MGLLILGIGLVGAVVGFMVGASNTPVVGAAIPVVFGVITAALAVIGRSQVPLAKELVEIAKNPGWHDRAQDLLDNELRRARETPSRFGVVLIVFAVLYAGASFAGVQARTNAWLMPKPVAGAFPWEGNTAPGTVERALEWLTVSQNLRAAGYSEEKIRDLYKIELDAIQAVVDSATAKQDFPWDSTGVSGQSKAAPTTVAAVMAWISFRDFMLARGFSDEQVANLYQTVRLEELDSEGSTETPLLETFGSSAGSGLTTAVDVIGGGGLDFTPPTPRCSWYCDVFGPLDLSMSPMLPHQLRVPYMRFLLGE